LLGFMPQAEALHAMEDTDCLLLTMTNDISMPGKTYEYLAARKPIIALSPQNGEVFRLIQQTGAGWCVDYLDRQAIGELLTRLQKEKQERGSVNKPLSHTNRSFERPKLVADYAAFIANLVH